MRQTIFLLTVLLLYPIITTSQSDFSDNEMKWTKGWTNYDPNSKEYPESEEKLHNIIDYNAFLSNDKVYLMSGNVYVTNGATLTIEEGTIIRCDAKNIASLVITRGAKLIAKGTKSKPIVFTSNKNVNSRKPGDWGGVIIAGSANVNSPSGTGLIEGNYLPQYSVYGGGNNNTVSTIMSYVRIEYAGNKINRSKEINGLSLYALSKNSIIDNIMISYSADDSFECFGGYVDMNNLISYKAKDDDFDFTQGYQGELRNIIAIRHPYISDISGSYAIEIDGYDKALGFIDRESLSFVKIRNATLINLSDQKNYQHTTAAISSKNMARIGFTDSKISGFANVVKFDKSYVSHTDLANSFSLKNSVLNVHTTPVMITYEEEEETEKILQYNMFTNHFQSVEAIFTDPLNDKNPEFLLKENLGNSTVMQ